MTKEDVNHEEATNTCHIHRSYGADRVVRLWELDLGPIPLGQLHK